MSCIASTKRQKYQVKLSSINNIYINAQTKEKKAFWCNPTFIGFNFRNLPLKLHSLL